MQIEQLIEKMYTYLLTYGLNVVAAILIFIIGKFIVGILTSIIHNIMTKSKVDVTLVGFVKNLAYVGLMAFVVIAALGKLGIQTTSFVAIIGAAGLAVGLALQGSLANFAAGVILILFKPFKVGDFIIAGGEMGTVKEIQIFNTILAHPDNRKTIVPNAQVTGTTITNFSAIENRRVDLIFGISYNDNIKKAKEALEKVIAADSRILKNPKPVIAVSALGDSSVNLVCRPWVKPSDYWDVYFNVLEQGKLELEKSGITIPFPQRDVHIYNEQKSGK
ncbi:MAG: mechanosensitive ion channel domain-containing protein [Candidatus Omnitrophota bacterium]